MEAETLAQYNAEFFKKDLISHCLCNTNFDLTRARAARRAEHIKKQPGATQRTLQEPVQASLRCGVGEFTYLKFDHETALVLEHLNIKWSCFRRPIVVQGCRNEVCTIELDDVILEFRITEYEKYSAGELCTPIQDPVKEAENGPLGRMVKLTIRPLAAP